MQIAENYNRKTEGDTCKSDRQTVGMLRHRRSHGAVSGTQNVSFKRESAEDRAIFPVGVDIQPRPKRELYTSEFAASVSEHNRVEVSGPMVRGGKRFGHGRFGIADGSDGHICRTTVVKVDITSLANSLEGTVTFLDQQIDRICRRRCRKTENTAVQTKSMLKKVAARLVPKEVVYRRKMVSAYRWPSGSAMT